MPVFDYSLPKFKLYSHHLDQRLEDINFWQSELQRKLGEITVETDTLLESKARLEKALQACEEPFAISQTCLLSRCEIA